ncbi:DUF6527 family protein [Maribacter sp. LLG6340-A2]|uniref:DUF6527 family protein n=1 Tax=Maribacter sp. LLG6340-A2 TaxID=3160834 RepID=UPI003867AC1C
MVMQHKFVELMPDTIKEGIIYISPEYGTVIHLCACGCGEEINTPLSPTGWELTYNGKFISLSPSIGNWSYICRSHYWILKNKVIWAEDWSENQVNLKRQNDKKESESYYSKNKLKENSLEKQYDNKNMKIAEKDTFWTKMLKIFK